MNNQELEQFLKLQLLENPFLYDEKSIKAKQAKDASHGFEDYTASLQTVFDFLTLQLGENTSSKSLYKAGTVIIGMLDDDGYMRYPVNQLAEEQGLPLPLLQNALELIQTFDPPGIAARDLGECLRLQLINSGVKDEVTVALTKHLDELARGKFKQIARQLGTTVQHIENGYTALRALNPKLRL